MFPRARCGTRVEVRVYGLFLSLHVALSVCALHSLVFASCSCCRSFMVAFFYSVSSAISSLLVVLLSRVCFGEMVETIFPVVQTILPPPVFVLRGVDMCEEIFMHILEGRSKCCCLDTLVTKYSTCLFGMQTRTSVAR